MRNPVTVFRSFASDIRMFLSAYFFLTFSYHGVQSVLLNLYLIRLGYRIELVGLTIGLIFFSFSFASIPVGVLLRRCAARRLIVCGAWALLGGFGLLMANELVPRPVGMLMLALAAVATGAGGALCIVPSLPLLMSCTLEQRSSVFSYRYLVSMIGGAAGSFIAGILPGVIARMLGPGASEVASHRGAMGCALFGYCLNLCFVYRIRGIEDYERRDIRPPAVFPDSTRSSRVTATKTKLPVGLLAVVFACGLLGTMGSNVFHSLFNVYLDRTFDVPASVVGSVYGFARAIQIPGLLVAPILVARFGPFRMRLVSPIASVVLILLVALTGNLTVSIGSFLAIGLSSSVASGAGDLFGQSIVASGQRGIMAGVTSAAFGLGGSIMMAAGGFIISFSGFPTLFTVASATIFTSLVVQVLYFRPRLARLLPEYHGPSRL